MSKSLFHSFLIGLAIGTIFVLITHLPACATRLSPAPQPVMPPAYPPCPTCGTMDLRIIGTPEGAVPFCDRCGKRREDLVLTPTPALPAQPPATPAQEKDTNGTPHQP